MKAVAEYYSVSMTATACAVRHIAGQLFCLFLFQAVPFLPQEYKTLFEGAGNNPGEKTLEDKFFEYEVFSVGNFAGIFCVVLEAHLLAKCNRLP